MPLEGDPLPLEGDSLPLECDSLPLFDDVYVFLGWLMDALLF